MSTPAAAGSTPPPRGARADGAASSPAAPPVGLGDLPCAITERIVLALATSRDLAAANGVGRCFRGAPGGRSPLEHALRERAHARGHGHGLLAALPPAASSWAEELIARERVLEYARANHVHVACASGAATALVDTAGVLHTCGEQPVRRAEGGRVTHELRAPASLGHPAAAPVLVPTPVPSLVAVHVVAVALGAGHCLALSARGAVYGCGGNARGQLGLGDTAPRHAFTELYTLARELVVAIAAGGGHSSAVGAAGAVYSWGANNYGQLGHGDTAERWEPTRVEALGGVRVGGVSAGAAHTLLVGTNGAVYSCGCGDHGRLGHGDTEQRWEPTRIEALDGERLALVSAGAEHSLVVSSAGRAYSFGGGFRGPLGHADEANQLRPKRIDALAGQYVRRVSAGVASSLAVDGAGGVHAFGDNTNGQLGHASPYLTTPTRVPDFAADHVADAAVGGRHAIYVTVSSENKNSESGAGGTSAVHSCGRWSAALGHGVSMADGPGGIRDISAPTRIEQFGPPPPRGARPAPLGAGPCGDDGGAE